jgi:hypothetical protein
MAEIGKILRCIVMGKVIKFSKYQTEAERQHSAQQGYTQFLIRHHRMKQEAAEKRKDREEQQE